ncbi:MAG TPA: MaoC family dehydratase [Acidimicrobiales bacterium]|nr:MaoC family dehydratase [Acidimicrobiales bacterium]
MSTNAKQAYETMQATQGQSEGTGEWFEVTQDLIDTFADATHDHQFIHVDPERAKASPFGGTIAHGFLTLSLLTHLVGSIRSEEARPAPRMEGLIMGVNYGFDKVRFVSPVKSGSKVRASGVTKSVELKGSAINTTRTITVEIEGEDKPALVADWITRLVFA